MTVQTHDHILNEAALWYARVSQGRLSAEDGQAFDTWLSDPSHLNAFTQVSETWDSLQAVADRAVVTSLRSATVATPVEDHVLAGSDGRSPAPVFEQDGLAPAEPEGAEAARPNRRHFLIGATLTALAASAAMILMPTEGLEPFDLQTANGERREQALADGSVVTLDGASRVVGTGEAGKRALELKAGRALFNVKADDRPFIVRSGKISVTATGTLFSVERLHDQVQIELYEGGVVVQSPAHQLEQSIKPVSRLIIFTDDRQPLLVALDDDRGQSWVHGDLVFVNETLAVAAERLARTSTQRIEVDPGVALLRVSGVFRAGEATGFVDAVTALLDVEAGGNAGSIRLQPKGVGRTERLED